MTVLKLSRTLLGMEDDCLYLSTYVPPSSSPFYDSADSNCHIAEVEKCICDLEELGDVNIICNSDFNARTANYQVNQDFVQNYENDMVDKIEMLECSRISQDSQINDFGKRLLELCTLFDLQLINGCRPWDNHGKFTFISYQGCSVVDYFLMSSSLLDFVHTLSVEDRIESDHMPVELYCNFYTDQNARLGEKIPGKKEKIFWCEEKVNDVKDYVTSVEFRDHVERAIGMMDDCINASIEIFTQALLTAAGCMLKTVKVITGTQNRSSWFDTECHKKKKDVRKCLRRLEIPEILTILLFTKASVRNTNVCCRRRNAKNKTLVWIVYWTP